MEAATDLHPPCGRALLRHPARRTEGNPLSEAPEAEAPLLAVQRLDSATDKLQQQRISLPERAELEKAQQQITACDADRDAARERRGELERAERKLASDVSGVVDKAKEVETSIYSGTVTAPKELAALTQELSSLNERKEEIEGEEMGLLEQVEEVDAELERIAARRSELEGLCRDIEEKIAAAEGRIDGRIAELAGERDGCFADVPSELGETYLRLRGVERHRGLAAVALRKNLCDGCKVTLPVNDVIRFKQEPPEAVLRCPQCERILVR